MPKVSIVVPTCNRPEMLGKALQSILSQSFQDFEVIVVDDGDEALAREVVQKYNDFRITYIKHELPRKGGGAARNTGIKKAKADVIAFLDDDDTWNAEKLEEQYHALIAETPDVGFSYTAVNKLETKGISATSVAEGARDLHLVTLTRFKGFLTSTLLVKKEVFEKVGYFDEALPSHQEAELILRITQKFKGLGINKPLTTMNLLPHKHIGADIARRIEGRLLVLEKHKSLFGKFPRKLARHYFWVGLWYRDSAELNQSRRYFLKSFLLSYSPLCLAHWFRTFFIFKSV